MKPYWYKLIDSWVNIENRNGLTIPFIIGARKKYITPPLEINNKIISDLFREIVNTDMPQIVSLFFCGEVKEFVLGLDDIGGIGRELIFYKSTQPTLVIGNYLFEKQSPLDQIISKLSENYLNHIYKEEYSKNKGIWGDYTTVEKNFIRNALELK